MLITTINASDTVAITLKLRSTLRGAVRMSQIATESESGESKSGLDEPGNPVVPEITPPPTGQGHPDHDVMDGPIWGLTDGDRRFLGVCCAAIIVLTTWHLLRLHWPQTASLQFIRPSDRVLQYRIDINKATWVEWMQLPEIGETLARNIVADRAARGPFQSIEDVDRVRGIGPATMNKIRPFLDAPETGQTQNGSEM